ncbi:MAG: YdcF family protein [Gammaproteobacteria bacterium]|uniref:YdcF family protein n=1 Tax=Candidatus Thiopontia autotrophica TaxID=2841688 RepID=A0A8J6P7M9_9GAMM|nr:YdcF family protein [Candidatus Thiopontia autotrophica]MBL6969052.1 YdcF family protein [Gammaproteobacteria bacterium]
MTETIRLIEAWLMPPGGVLLVLMLALLVASRRRRFATTLIWAATSALYLFSTPWMMFKLAEQLETISPLQEMPVLERGQLAAIVVLGGGRYTAAPEFGRDVVGTSTLARLRYGAYLHRQTALPILVTGGTPLNEAAPESQLMADSLRDDFAIADVWQENKSINTWEHARFVPPVLRQKGVSTVVLVTHASHLPRALRVFQSSPEMEGMTIIPAPTAFTTKGKMDHGFGMWRPSAGALSKNVTFLHEWGGMLWYQIRYSADT